MGLMTTLLMAGWLSAAPSGGLMGDWMTSGGSVVRVAKCADAICMTVVKVAPDAKESEDKLNPDVALRTRPLCGMKIGEGFKADGEGAASGGKVYDPESGKTYSGKVERKGDTLRLRGFIGVSLFGRTEVWKSVGKVEACRPA